MEVIVPVLATASHSCHTRSNAFFEVWCFGKCPVVDFDVASFWSNVCPYSYTSSSTFSLIPLSITILGCEISYRSVTLAEQLSSSFPPSRALTDLLGCHQCLVAVSSSVRVPPPPNLLWEWDSVHLPPRFTILLTVGWHLVSDCNCRDLCTIPSRVPAPHYSQKGVSHHCPSICIAWPCLRIVVSVFYTFTCTNISEFDFA